MSIKLTTSEISGTQSNVTISSDKIVAGIKATTLFLAPLIVTSPFKGRPPLITIFFIFSSFKEFLIKYTALYYNTVSGKILSF